MHHPTDRIIHTTSFVTPVVKYNISFLGHVLQLGFIPNGVKSGMEPAQMVTYLVVVFDLVEGVQYSHPQSTLGRIEYDGLRSGGEICSIHQYSHPQSTLGRIEYDGHISSGGL